MDAQAWDRIAGSYFEQINTPFQAEVINPLLDYLDGLPGREKLTVADLGCGIGNLLPFWQNAFRELWRLIFLRRCCVQLKKTVPTKTYSFAGKV